MEPRKGRVINSMIIRHHEVKRDTDSWGEKCPVWSFPEKCCSPHSCSDKSQRVTFPVKKSGKTVAAKFGKYFIKGVGMEQAGTLMRNQSGNECS